MSKHHPIAEADLFYGEFDSQMPSSRAVDKANKRLYFGAIIAVASILPWVIPVCFVWHSKFDAPAMSPETEALFAKTNSAIDIAMAALAQEESRVTNALEERHAAMTRHYDEIFLARRLDVFRKLCPASLGPNWVLRSGVCVHLDPSGAEEKQARR